MTFLGGRGLGFLLAVVVAVAAVPRHLYAAASASVLFAFAGVLSGCTAFIGASMAMPPIAVEQPDRARLRRLLPVSLAPALGLIAVWLLRPRAASAYEISFTPTGEQTLDAMTYSPTDASQVRVPPLELTNDEDRALHEEVEHRLSLQRLIGGEGAAA
jgi:hypothetical protein